MGGISLLTVALMGITCGWQPDQAGGVEYIVQVSPEELRQLDRLGEISSVIDPAVVGRVSKIKIRVGTGPVPRELPASIAKSPVSRPPAAEPPQHAEQGQSRIVAMKPDPQQDITTGGFQLPQALQNGAAETADQIRRGVDQAGREIGQRGKQMMNDFQNQASDALRDTVSANPGNRVAPPSTRVAQPNRQGSVPPFTGSQVPANSNAAGPYGNDSNRIQSPALNRPMATTRPGGPSTEPTQARDQTWQYPSTRRSAGPTTEPLPASGSARTSTFQHSGTNRAASQTRSSQPNAPKSRLQGDTFGRLPNGLTLPRNEGADLDNRTAGTRTAAATGARSTASEWPGRTNDYSDGVYTQQQQWEIDRQRRLADANGVRAADPPQRDAAPDPRLTATQRAAGAWSIDRYGRLFDRYGRPISVAMQADSGDRPSSPALDRGRQAYPYRSDDTRPDLVGRQAAAPESFASGDARYGNESVTVQAEDDRWGQQRYAPSWDQPAYRQPPPPERTSRYDPRAAQPSQADPTRRSINHRGPESLSDRRDEVVSDSVPRQSGPAPTRTRSIAAQPLFNGLLLISFVANIYLIFWLKNLRIRFRDLVAAKRVAGSNAPAAS